MSKIVRTSKFRHVFAEPAKPENQFSDLELSPVTGDHNYIRGNNKFFAVSAKGGGGPVLVLPLTSPGKLPRGQPLLNGHSGAVMDTAWNPFNDNMLATGSDDATIKLWSIPDGGLTENMKEPLMTLEGHGKPVTLLNWNPVANNVLASVGKEPSVRVWDVTKGTTGCTLTGFEGLIQDFAWNHNGTDIITSDKGKSAKIWDVRAGTVSHEFKPHAGGKPFKCIFLGGTGTLVTAGFTAQAKREFKLWSLAAGFEKPLTTIDLDQQSGALMPFYDEDTRMLYLTGKGDGNIRYYELSDEAPYVFPLTEYRSNVSTKGADMLPKRGLKVMGCEVAHMLKLTSNCVEPLSFIVPRKETTFQEDIFPDTYAGIPSLEAEAWFGGANVAGPKKVSLNPSAGGVVSAGGAMAASRPAVLSSGGAGSPISPSSNSGSGGGGGGSSAADTARIAELEAALKRSEARVAQLEGENKSLTAAVSAAVSSSSSGSGSGGADAEEVEALKARVAELEASETKLKKAVAALSA